MLYLDSPNIQVKFIDNSDNNTIKNINLNLITYGSLGPQFAYLDAPLNSAFLYRNNFNKVNKINKIYHPLTKKNTY